MFPVDQPAGPSPDGPPLVSMTARELEELPDADLLARCVAPTIRRLYGGDRAARVTGLAELTGGQGGLLAFWILHRHTRDGLTGFCAELPHRLVHDGFWVLLEKGLPRVEAGDLLPVVRRMRIEVSRALAEGEYPQDLGRDGELDHEGFVRLVQALKLLDPEAMRRLDEDYRRIAPAALRHVARFIREHLDELVSIEGPR